MYNYFFYTLLFAILIFLYDFKSSSDVQTNRFSPSDNYKDAIPQQTEISYEGIYLNSSGLGVFNSITKKDSVIFPGDLFSSEWNLSANKKYLSFTYCTKDSTSLIFVDLTTFQKRTLKTMKGINIVTQSFGHNDSILFFSFQISKKRNNKYLTDKSYLFSFTINTQDVKYLSMFDKKYFTTWLPQNYIVITDENNKYSFMDGKTLKVIYSHKFSSSVTFSPNGKKCFYYEPVEFINDDFEEITRNALNVADFNGNNNQVAVSASYDPKNVQWSPDSKKISCDIKSKEWIGIRHLCIYNMELRQATYNSNPNDFGMPSITNPIWSPSGNRLIFKRRMERGDENISYTAVGLILRNISDGAEINILTGNSSSELDLGGWMGMVLGWFDENNICLSIPSGTAVYNVPRKVFTTFSLEKGQIIYLWEAK